MVAALGFLWSIQHISVMVPITGAPEKVKGQSETKDSKLTCKSKM